MKQFDFKTMPSLFDNFVYIFVLITCAGVIAANDNVKDDNMDRGAHSDRGGLWFGPRLGKRSLAHVDEDNRQTFLRLLEAADNLKDYYNPMSYEMQADVPQPRVTKKVTVPPKPNRGNGQRRINPIYFTPRLGRRLPEPISPTPAEEELYRPAIGFRPAPMMVDPENVRFTPPLGRTYAYQPTFGRELADDIYSEPQTRVSRSINNTKST